MTTDRIKPYVSDLFFDMFNNSSVSGHDLVHRLSEAHFQQPPDDREELATILNVLELSLSKSVLQSYFKQVQFLKDLGADPRIPLLNLFVVTFTVHACISMKFGQTDHIQGIMLDPDQFETSFLNFAYVFLPPKAIDEAFESLKIESLRRSVMYSLALFIPSLRPTLLEPDEIEQMERCFRPSDADDADVNDD